LYLKCPLFMRAIFKNHLCVPEVNFPKYHCNITSKRFIFESTWKRTSDKLHQSHFERRLIRTTPEKLFVIVAEVDKYKEFVPYCLDSKIISQKGNILEAELVVGFKLLEERYKSIVTLEYPKNIKVAVTSSSLFHYLTNSWEFEAGPEPNTCWTSFAVAFKFKSEIHRTLTDIFFNEVQKRMLHAFEQRANDLEHKK